MTEADIVADGLDTQIRQFPFQFPGSSPLLEERIRLAAGVSDGLTERGLIRRGKLLPELEEGFRLLSRYHFAIAVMGTIASDRETYARVCADARSGVLVVADGEQIGLQPIRAEELLRAAIGLLPALPPGPGQSVTVTQQAKTPARVGADDEGFQIPFVQGGSSSGAAQQRAAEEILRRPRTGAGYFVGNRRDPTGETVNTPALNWLDTDAGRYMVTSGQSGDGATWATYSPADYPRIERKLYESIYT
ncbi:MAG: ESX secretion-associated protein EspG [Sciscionella sp.]